MAIHKVGEHEVDFSADTHHAEKFLTHRNNFHAAQSYLNEAKEHGKSYVYANNFRYEVRHKTGEDGKDQFSVHYAA